MTFWQKLLNFFEKNSPRSEGANRAATQANARIDAFLRGVVNHPYWSTEKDPADLTVVTSKKDRCWYRDGVLHRDGAPAVMGHNGSAPYEHWYQYGALHREGGPAIVNGNYHAWYKNGKLHRVGGPAIDVIDRAEGSGQLIRQKWFVDGLLHREDGPAIELSSGYRKWFMHGKLHRLGGPAIEHLLLGLGYEYWAHGKPHCENGPAVVWPQYHLEAWYINGQLHRDSAPAIRKYDTEVWLWRGRLHREDGPAVCIGTAHKSAAYFMSELRWSRHRFSKLKFTLGEKQYWVFGERYSEEAYKRYLTRKADASKLKD